jgi:hypothetical protein
MRTTFAFLAGATMIACASIAGDRGTDDAVPGDDASTSPDGSGGDGTSNVEISTDKVDIGNVLCGNDVKAPITVTLTNKGDSEVPYSLTIPDGSPFHVLEPTAGTIAAHSALVFTFMAKPTESGPSAADVLVKVGTVSRTIAVTVKGSGPKLQILPGTADLGEVRAQSGATVDVELQNVGDTTLALKDFVPQGDASGFSMTWKGGTTSINIGAGMTVPAQVTLAPGTASPNAAVATFVPTVTSPHCGPIPTLGAKGHLVDRSVTFTIADFDKQDCSSNPITTKDITISNYSTSAITVTPDALPAGTRFTYQSTTPVMIPAANGPPTTGKFTVGLLPIGATLPPAPVVENLSFVVTGVAAPDGGARTTTARVDIRGALLVMTPNPLTGFRGADCTKTQFCADIKQFTIRNDGNDSVTLGYAANRLSGPAAWQGSFPNTISPGNHSANMLFGPMGTCATCEIQYTMVRQSGTNLCTPPAVMDFKGTTN